MSLFLLPIGRSRLDQLTDCPDMIGHPSAIAGVTGAWRTAWKRRGSSCSTSPPISVLSRNGSPARCGRADSVTQTTFTLTSSQHAELLHHLFPDDGCEAVALIPCGRRADPARHRLVAQRVIPVPYDARHRPPSDKARQANRRPPMPASTSPGVPEPRAFPAPANIRHRWCNPPPWRRCPILCRPTARCCPCVS